MRTSGKSQIILGVFPSITWVSGGKRPVNTIVIISAEGDVRSDPISRIFLDAGETVESLAEGGSLFKRESALDLEDVLPPGLEAAMSKWLKFFCLVPIPDGGGDVPVSAEWSNGDGGGDTSEGVPNGDGLLAETSCCSDGEGASFVTG